VPSPEPTRSPAPAAELVGEQLVIEARTQRRTALVALRGELDLVTVSKVAEVLDASEPQAGGVRHIVLDLRGLTFMDLIGLRELAARTSTPAPTATTSRWRAAPTLSTGCWS
jgi:hypothetical protein